MIDYEKLKTRRGLWKKTEQPGYVKKTCQIEGCQTKYYTQGYCAKHYHRVKKHGNPDTVTYHYSSVYPTLEDYFHKNTIKETNGCWIWTGTKLRRGYGGVGSTRWGKQFKIYSAHRLSYFYYKGEIPEGIFVCHSCDNPSCINPEHLFLGTHVENMKDMYKKGRDNHPLGEKAFRAKLSKDQAIYVLQNIGLKSAQELGDKFNVSRQTIRNIWNGITKYIEPDLYNEIKNREFEPKFEGEIVGFKCDHESDGRTWGTANEIDYSKYKCAKCGEFY